MIQRAFSKPNLVNLISKGEYCYLVLYFSVNHVYPLDGNYGIIIDFQSHPTIFDVHLFEIFAAVN